MNIEEAKKAIKGLNNIIEYWTHRPEEVATAKLAIEALEKQIPKKPLKITMEYDGDYGHCPSCNEILADYSDTRVCKSCGQKIDWGNDE